MRTNTLSLILFALISLFMLTVSFAEVPTDPLGIRLEGYSYPYPVKYFDLKNPDESLQMAYMDVMPAAQVHPQTIILLHGGLAFGAYWKDTIKFLTEKGYRVIVPDQIGFGKSSKEKMEFSFQHLAENTKKLLDHLDVHQAIIVGHSMGGMLAVRFALLYPDVVSKLVLEDPLGLEDYSLKIPFKSTEEIYQLSLHPTWESILNQHKALYANWDDRYLEYAEVAYRVSLNKQFHKVATAQARIYEMIYSDPIINEIAKMKVPTLLLYGSEDRTAPGKGFASEEVQKTLGDFPVLVKNAAAMMPNAQVKRFENVGHVPHLEATKQFNFMLLEYLTS